mgnify:CR=1 FL=1
MIVEMLKDAGYDIKETILLPDEQKKLEKELGCTLFVRQRHGIALTPEGEKLYAHISVAFEHISYGEQEIARDKSLPLQPARSPSTVSFFPP